MKHDCITDMQGRCACTCSRLHTTNGDKSSPTGSEWDWIDAIPRPIDRVLLILIALVIVAGFIKFFKN